MFSGMQFGVAPRTYTKMTHLHVERDWTTCSNMNTILGSIVNISGGAYMAI